MPEQAERKGWRAITADFPASIVVFLVALPLCMGIAIASGVPPARGLITGIVGGLVVGLLAGSPLQVSGPAAGLSVIVFEIVQRHGLAALGVIVLLGGAFQLVAGLLRGGRYFQAVPPSVVFGMLAGIGVLILSSQFHVMVDDKPRGSGIANVVSIPVAIYKGIFPVDGSVHHVAAGVGLVSLAVLLAWNKFAPKRAKVVPGALVAVVVATAGANLLGLPIRYVSVPENLLGTVDLPGAGTFGLLLDPAILGSAVTLAVIASAETLLCATAVDRMHQGPRTNYDRELAAQGVGNMICGALGALPMTGVIVRSSANVGAGAKTRASAVMHGAWLLILVAAAPFVLSLVPVASLAAILVFTGYKLINVEAIKALRKHGRSEVFIYAATVVGIVVTDLLTGVLIGLGLALAKLLYTFSGLELRLERDPGARKATLVLDGTATFLRLPALGEALSEISPEEELELDISHVRYVDHACIEAIAAWEKQHSARGGRTAIDWPALHKKALRPRPTHPGSTTEPAGPRHGEASAR